MLKRETSDGSRRIANTGRAVDRFHDGERAILRQRFFKRLKGINAAKLRRALARGRKWMRLRRTQHPEMDKLPVFVVGCNRSGTNMVCGAIGKSSHGWDYRESALSIAFNGYYLRSNGTIKWLIRHTPATLISFGCILDSQFTDELLSQFDNSKAIWVYRRYQDVANSCARMQWGHQLKDYARWVASGELEKLGARGNRISDDTVRLFGELFHEGLSIEECACLYWYMRNQLYIELDLHTNPRVLIVNYEDAVQNQAQAFRRVFDFLGLPYESPIIEGIFSSSVSKHSWRGVEPAIQEICDSLTAKLDAHFASTMGWPVKGSRSQPIADSHLQIR